MLDRPGAVSDYETAYALGHYPAYLFLPQIDPRPLLVRKPFRASERSPEKDAHRVLPKRNTSDLHVPGDCISLVVAMRRVQVCTTPYAHARALSVLTASAWLYQDGGRVYVSGPEDYRLTAEGDVRGGATSAGREDWSGGEEGRVCCQAPRCTERVLPTMCCGVLSDADPMVGH
eukprot:693566-Rhodomonas_salina.2